MNVVEIEQIDVRLAKAGLRLCGYFSVQADDELPLSSGTLCLVGQITQGWEKFRQSTEYQQGINHPLDTYAFRVCQAIADTVQGQVIMPSDGPPFYPFQRWAQRVEAVYHSPLGLLFHPQFGLWHAYRAAILVPNTLAPPDCQPTQDFCAPCHQPCLSACPVDAFSEDSYNVVACKKYLQDNTDALCHTAGCLARVACPQGKTYEYQHKHKAFLMRAFTAK